ncbi:11160_t:CDS:2 [Entrophospora sp. SA101]|nr:11160_t:CDS:2 [Entrophospora sp. SA101]CAJ0826713.1 16506_t:CDS:2 [Entrophospora sp. SA101]CAJ0830529.1 16950_t:CDS:2 [Entrophospora sp. SA101]CAJ0904035.1 1255_t:CDS:2 [Entrophospora sp. SA101]
MPGQYDVDTKTTSNIAEITNTASSSLSSSPPAAASANDQQNLDRRLLISFTCKVCSHQSTKTMSKHSYDHGVVIIQCPSCNNNHLIADHLGWFRDGKTTIEDLMLEKGEKVLKFIADEKFEWNSETIGKGKLRIKLQKNSIKGKGQFPEDD